MDALDSQNISSFEVTAEMSMDAFSSQIAHVSAYNEETALGGNVGGLDG